MRSGKVTSKLKDISFSDALNDPITRPEYIRRKLMQYCYDLSSLTLIASRPPSIEMVVGNLHHCRFAIDKEDALWHTISCS